MPTSATPPAAPAASADWPLRVLALVPLVGVALLWSNHHLGLGAGHSALLASLAAVLPMALGVMNHLLEKDEQAAVEKGLRRVIASRLSWRLLLVAYLVLATVVLSWTSVLVLAEDGGRLGRVTLQPLDDPGAAALSATAAKGEPARFVLASHPLGRPFRLEVEGFVPKVVEVFPVLGLRVLPGTDLRRAPSVLLRFSGIAVGSWRDVGGAELRIVALDAGNAERLVASLREPAGAVLLGRGQPVPSGWPAGWQIELLAKGVTNPTLAARELQAWKKPRWLAPALGLEPGQRLRVTLSRPRQQVFASAEFFLGADELQDQPVEDLE